MRTFRFARSSRPRPWPAVLGEEPRSEVYIPGMRTVHTLQEVPESASNRAHKTGAAPHCAAPPRLYFGITCVSARSLTASDSMSGPAPQLLSTTQSEQRVGRRWRVRSPEATGSRSRGRRVQTLLPDHCSLDSPPLPVALWVATIDNVTFFVPAQAVFTHSLQSLPQTVPFCRQTVPAPRHGREGPRAPCSSAPPEARSPARGRR